MSCWGGSKTIEEDLERKKLKRRKIRFNQSRRGPRRREVLQTVSNKGDFLDLGGKD